MQVEVKSLDWSDVWNLQFCNPQDVSSLGKFDVILCSDLVYHVKVLKPLSRLLNELSDEKTIIYMAHKSRHDSVDEALFPAMEDFFDGDEIELEEHHPGIHYIPVTLFSTQEFQHDRIRIFKMMKRKVQEEK